MIIGYARVSTQDQNLERQTDQLQQLGCERIFQEKVSGSKKERPELDKLLDQLRAGDIRGYINFKYQKLKYLRLVGIMQRQTC